MADTKAALRQYDTREPTEIATHVYPHQDGIPNMTKKYAVIRSKVPRQEGGFVEAFRLGIVDLNCWGDDYYDAEGYPYPDDVHAFVHDWLNLGTDFETAMRKVNEAARQHNKAIAGTVDDGERSKESPASTKE